MKDLWALRLQNVRTRVSYDSETETEAQSSQAFSSQSESETASGSQSSRRSRRKDGPSTEETPTLIDTLSLCYIATLLLRIPVTVGNIHDWINKGELLYYRASRELPTGMKARLPPRYQELLEPQDLLQPQLMHQSIIDILMRLQADFGMALPSTNTPLILYRWVQELALPLEVYAATQRLAGILNVDGTFSGGSSDVVLRYPEVRLMALVMIAAKLLFPFDEIKRQPHSPTDLSALSMNWDEWTKTQQRENESDVERSRLSFEKAFSFTEADAIEATDDVLDDYLDWYQENIATEEVRERGRAGRDADFRRTLFEMFPVRSDPPSRRARPSTTTGEGVETRLRHTQSTLSLEPLVENDQTKDVPRSGSFYRRFRTAQELSGPVRIFYEKSAKLAGLPVDGMVQAVFFFERRLQKFEEELRKTEKAR